MEDVLVVVYRSPAIPRGGNNADTASRQKAFEDLDTDTALSDTSQKGGFLGECDTRGCNLRKNIKI